MSSEFTPSEEWDVRTYKVRCDNCKDILAELRMKYFVDSDARGFMALNDVSIILEEAHEDICPKSIVRTKLNLKEEDDPEWVGFSNFINLD